MSDKDNKPTMRKETSEEREARAKECMDQIEVILKNYSCEFSISLTISDKGVSHGTVTVIPSKMPMMVKEGN